MNETLENFLSFTIQHDPFSGPKRMYGQLDRFMKANFHSKPLLVMSLPLEHKSLKKEPLKYARAIWNKSQTSRTYSESSLNELLSTYFKNEKKAHWLNITIDNKNYCAFYCGKSETQNFIGIVKTDEVIDGAFLNKLVLFMDNTNSS
ncbi:hypothetical protein OAT67_09580, partial [Bacteriovoracaceae bacterium]|nr:hypothetical protein [Bacteriovoracaceae bacterium]